MSTRYRKVTYIEPDAFPMPNDVLPADWTVIASVWYSDEPPPLTATVILLTPQPPFFLVAFYNVANGELQPIGHYFNIVDAVAAYEQNGGDR